MVLFRSTSVPIHKMNAKMRYLMLLLSTIFLLLCYYSGKKLKRKLTPVKALAMPSYLSVQDLYRLQRQASISTAAASNKASCRMDTCFNFSRCGGEGERFGVYVYPYDEGLVPSDSYLKILNAVSESGYFTPEAEEACLFILSLDTLDRDVLSQVRFSLEGFYLIIAFCSGFEGLC
jgi:glucuronyl/N-acetylglucosaminyl transferase EXT1